MNAISDPVRESYRERLYRNYLANHRGQALIAPKERLRGAQPYFKRLVKHFPTDRDTRILELGCGYGVWLHWLRESGYRNLEGVDRSPEQVEAAHGLGMNFVVENDLAADLAARASESCDVVLAADILEHLTKDEALSMADQVFRVLAPGGLFILHLPNGDGIFAGHIEYGDFTHELIVTSTSLAQMLRCVGFTGFSAYEDTPVVHGFSSACRSLVWMAARTAVRLIFAAETGNLGRDLILSQNFLAVARKS